eukprot:6331600-Amphidinium_carterae.1
MRIGTSGTSNSWDMWAWKKHSQHLLFGRAFVTLRAEQHQINMGTRHGTDYALIAPDFRGDTLDSESLESWVSSSLQWEAEVFCYELQSGKTLPTETCVARSHTTCLVQQEGVKGHTGNVTPAPAWKNHGCGFHREHKRKTCGSCGQQSRACQVHARGICQTTNN